jgi:hypothetical protein
MQKFALTSTLVALFSVLASSANSPTKLHVLVYETENDALGAESPSQRLVDQINRDGIEGMHATVYGHKNRGGFAGYGSKFSSVVPILELISQSDDDALVVLSDSRDVLVNNPFNDKTYSKDLVNEFRVAFDDATAFKPKSIVVSAEAQCCVSALTHVPLGGYYNTDGSRSNIACSSGSEGCLWAGDDKAEPWERFMNERMLQQSFGKKYDDAYLNAGLIVGKPKDLLRVILSAQINDNEDDQAVWTDYMYHNPNDIVLDYQQQLFGNNRGGVANIHDGGCVFHKQPDSKRLVHMMTHTQPLFLHSPGAFFACHDQMSQALGVPKVGATIRRLLRTHDKSRRTQCNYGRSGTECNEETEADGGSFFGGLFDFLGGGDSSAAVPTAAPVSSIGDLLNRPNTTDVPPTSLSDLLTNTSSTNSSLSTLLTNTSSANSTLSNLLTNASTTDSSLSGLLSNTSETNSSLSTLLGDTTSTNSSLSTLLGNTSATSTGLSGFLTNSTNATTSLAGLLTNSTASNTTLANSSSTTLEANPFVNTTSTGLSGFLTNSTNATTSLGGLLTSSSSTTLEANPFVNTTGSTNLGSLLTGGTTSESTDLLNQTLSTAAPVAAPTVFSFFNMTQGTTTTSTSSVVPAPSTGTTTDGITSLSSYLNTATVAPATAGGLTSLLSAPVAAPVGTLEGLSRDAGSKPDDIVL